MRMLSVPGLGALPLLPDSPTLPIDAQQGRLDASYAQRERASMAELRR